MFKTLNKARNRKFIIVYYALALVFVAIGLIFINPTFYVMAVAFIILASIRKYWLMKRLKD